MDREKLAMAVENFERLRQGGHGFDAICWFMEARKIAERMTDVDESHRQKLVQGLDPELLEKAGKELPKRIDKNMHILAFGTRWDEDEILLILTICTEVDLVVEALQESGSLPESQEDDVQRMEAAVLELKGSRENRNAFESAVRQLRRTARVKSRWLFEVKS